MDEIDLQLQGNWELTETKIVSRGYRPPDNKPETENKFVSFNNGTYKVIEDGKETESQQYTFTEVRIGNEPLKYSLLSEDFNGQVNFYDKDSLSIGDLGSCAIIHYFKRKKDRN